MAPKLFGTDGIRGLANVEPMTAETALRVAMAAGRRFIRGDHRHLVVIGKDTRLSGYMLEPALAAGFISMGMDVVMSGPIPTPGVAMLTRTLRAELGVMITASHNPFNYSGIKLFGPDGYKLSDDVERIIEQGVSEGMSAHLAKAEKLGRAKRLDDAQGRYIEFVKNTFPRGLRLDGYKIVIDCAHGAAYKVAPSVLWELGAEVIPIAVDPNGFNINEKCGATHTETMREAVVAHGADLGIALDGDADRVIMADETGRQVDGDQLMALVGRSWGKSGRLKGGGIVGTVMSNLGLERYLGGLGLSLQRAKVGDRYVIEMMRDGGFNVGGEQSGHLVLNDYITTGDGLIAALQALAVIVETDRPVSEVTRCFEPLPQILKNVRYTRGQAPLDNAAVKDAIKDGEGQLKGAGRVLIRPSGTEPVIRVMAEGEDAAVVGRVVDGIAQAIARAAG